MIMLIPKFIYQTCPDKTKLHPKFLENIDFIKLMNPDWGYRLFDHHDRREFIEKHYPIDYLKAYDSLQSDYGAAKADFFRYLLIYELGGVYLDLKSRPNLPLSDVIQKDDAFILSEWDNGKDGEFPGAGCWGRYGVLSEYQQWHVIAMPKHPYLKAVIEQVKNNIENYDPFKFGFGRIGTLRTTGPIPYTLSIKPIQEEFPHRKVQIKDLGVQYSIFADDLNAHRQMIGSGYATTKQLLVKVSLVKESSYKAFIFLKATLKNLEKVTIRPLARQGKNFFNP